MGLLSRLREWLGGGDAADDAAGAEPESEEAAGEPRLDPENVTEVRAGSEDDPVEKLRELRDGRGEEPDGETE